MTTRNPNIVLLGGGTGTGTVMRGLGSQADVTAILTVCDDGGSSGLISQDLNIGPVGDARQVLLAALESYDPTASEDFSHRFGGSIFNGHPLGNMLLAGLAMEHGGLRAAIKRFRTMFGIDHADAIPMAPGRLSLNLHLSNGEIVHGESELGEFCNGKGYFREGVVPNLVLEPAELAVLDQEAVDAIASADLIVIGPGKLYSSLAPLMLIKGMREALMATSVPIVYISNLMTLVGQTDGMCAADHAHMLEALLGAQVITHVVCNTTAPSQELLTQYASEGEEPVLFHSEEFDDTHFEAVASPLLSKEAREQNPLDLLVRTVIRHDPEALARAILEICASASAYSNRKAA